MSWGQCHCVSRRVTVGVTVAVSPLWRLVLLGVLFCLNEGVTVIAILLSTARPVSTVNHLGKRAMISAVLI